ncbi:uncharacterized protein LOC142324618 [Lycorma delicatula]|uniref:uncharacterized protein LOC142324618 n=1 Tax=Lycorma delicatula TaxID=130591 RepID=UPI003F51241E
MNFHVEHAVSEKSELAAEKAKRLEAEKEELRKKLEELKLLEKGNADKEKGLNYCFRDKQSRSTEAVNSVKFTATELKNVKHALNTKKLNDDVAKPIKLINTKTSFKKKKQSKGNQNEQGSDCSDDDDNDDDTANKDCSKNSETKESEGQTPRKQRNSQDVGGARKKDGSGIDSNKKKTNKNDNAGKQATTPGASNSKSGLSLFIGDKFPTLKDIETGKLSLTQNVKNISMVAKLDDGKPVTEVPETVQDMILFNMNYPDARIVVTE